MVIETNTVKECSSCIDVFKAKLALMDEKK